MSDISPTSTTTTIHLSVQGMMCQKNCGSTVEHALSSLPGAIAARVSFESSHAQVQFQNTTTDTRHSFEEEALEAVDCVGFEATLIPPEQVQAYLHQQQQQRLLHNEDSSSGTSETALLVQEDEEQQTSTLPWKNNSNNDNTATLSFQVGGMSCAICSGRVERALLQVVGVREATVSLPTHRAFIQILVQTHDESTTTITHNCVQAVTKAGYDCEAIPTHNNKQQGVSLADSAQRLERARLHELHTWRRLLMLAALLTLPLILLKQVHAQHQQQQHSTIIIMCIMCLLSTLVQFGVGHRFYRAAYMGWTNGRFLGMDFLVVMGTTASYIYSLVIFAWQLVSSSPSNMVLKPTFETGAMLLTFVTLGKFLEAYAKGKTASALQTLMELQPNYASRVVNADLEHLGFTEKEPHQHVFENDDKRKEPDIDLSSLQTEEVAATEIQSGDYVLVLPGARIPADGILVAASGSDMRERKTFSTTHTYAYIDESALSGEPFPVAKQAGETVFGSTVNQLSALLIRVTATGGQTVLAKIVRLMEEAQSQKAPIQAQADKIACIFAPAVMVLSAITFVAWLVFNSASLEERFFWAFTSAISVIVVACPCSMGLATPTAVMCGTGVGANHGLLIKGGAVLEGAHGIDTVVFDKTGTLTTSRAVLGDTLHFPLEELVLNLPSPIAKEQVALWLAACAEKQSEHPLAKAIVNAGRSLWGADITCSKEGVEVSDFHVMPGMGVECLVRQAMWGEYRVRVGTRSFTKGPVMEGDTIPEEEDVSDREILEMRQRGQVGVYVSAISERESLQKVNPQGRPYRRHVVGVLGIVDPIESEARSTVAALKKLGVDVWMCTGDDAVTAHAVARQVGIDEDNVCSGVSPEGKADLVTRLQKRDRTGRRGKRDRRSRISGRVAVVGDGINDAVALARSDVGIAIGAGTEVAVEAADMVLVKSSLHDVVVALHLSRVVFRRIRLNFVWALAYNLFALPFAAGALYPFTSFRLPPEFAGLMMAFSSVSVVTSSLLLRTYSKPHIREDGSLEMDRCMPSVLPQLCCTLRSRMGSRQPVLTYSDEGDEGFPVQDNLEMV